MSQLPSKRLENHTIRYVSSLSISFLSREFCIWPREKNRALLHLFVWKREREQKYSGNFCRICLSWYISPNFWFGIICWLMVWVWIQFLYFGVGGLIPWTVKWTAKNTCLLHSLNNAFPRLKRKIPAPRAQRLFALEFQSFQLAECWFLCCTDIGMKPGKGSICRNWLKILRLWAHNEPSLSRKKRRQRFPLYGADEFWQNNQLLCFWYLIKTKGLRI